LRVVDYKYICDRIAKFHKKILFIIRVINIQILTTKYFSFQYSVTYCGQALRRPAHRARKTVHLLTHETPNFITPALWPANSPDLNPVDYQIWWKLQDRMYRSHVTSTSWSRACSKSGIISTRWSSIKQSGSGIHISELAFDFVHTVDILNTDFRCAGVLPFARTHTWQSITPDFAEIWWLVCSLTSQCCSGISLKSDVVCQSYGNVYSVIVFSWTRCM